MVCVVFPSAPPNDQVAMAKDKNDANRLIAFLGTELPKACQYSLHAKPGNIAQTHGKQFLMSL